MNKEYVFKDSKNNFFVLGEPKCAVTAEKIDKIGWVRVSPGGYRFIGLKGLQEDKKLKLRAVQYFQFYVADDINDDFILVDFKIPSMVNGDNTSVFDVDIIDKKYPSETIDKTKLAGRESLDDTALIGSFDSKRLEQLDKPLDDVSEVEDLFEEITSNEIVVDKPNILMLGRDKKGGE